MHFSAIDRVTEEEGLCVQNMHTMVEEILQFQRLRCAGSGR